VHFVLLVGVVYFLFFLMYQKTPIAATPKFEERGGLSANFVTDDQNWSYLEASFSSATPNTLLERITGIRIGFRCDPLIECAAQNLADKFIDDKGRIFYGSIRVIGRHTYVITAEQNYTMTLQKELREEEFRKRMANIDKETHEKELVAVPA
jgi:hypothetical protein